MTRSATFSARPDAAALLGQAAYRDALRDAFEVHLRADRVKHPVRRRGT